jgi:hypothetical protein
MKLSQATAILAFIATGVVATPASYNRNEDSKEYSPSKANNGDYAGNKGGNHGDYGHVSRPGGGSNNGNDYEYGGKPGRGGKDHDDDDADDEEEGYGKGRGKGRGKDHDDDDDDEEEEGRGKGHGDDDDEDDHYGKPGRGDKHKKKYEGSFNYKVDCKKGADYKVTGKISSYDYKSKEQYLNVEYLDWDPKSDKKAYLGLYATKEEGPKKKDRLNLTKKYCHKNKCSVPVKKIPGYPKFKKSVWVGIDDDQCKNYKPTWPGYGGKHDYKGNNDSPKYIELKIDSKWN